MFKYEDSRVRYTDDEYYEMKTLWEEFKEDIKYGNRFFAGKKVIDILDELKTIDEYRQGKHKGYIELFNLAAGETTATMYRARKGNWLNKQDNELLAPPKGVATDGRCNPSGISYLYTSTKIETCINEVKLQDGDLVTVAEVEYEFKDIFSLHLYTTVQKHRRIPIIKDSKLQAFVDIVLNDMESEVKGNEVAKYIPLQFIAEYFKSRGAKGFTFNSTLGNGFNYVIFDWKDKCKVTKKYLYKYLKHGCIEEILSENTINDGGI